MKPPICIICHRDFRTSISEGGLVRFQPTQKDKDYNKHFEQDGFVGHKASEFWLCKKHYTLAKKYSHMICADAKELIENAQ